ncbi:hypothetical protein CN373_16805 [Bacillus cereus]|nr:hypothetical protein CN373_16805 [Bacillus cereus]PFO85910.1 hypothetical protein COJ77_00345 [Bacillus cereus]PFR26060.1 hypothetical protein COK19_13445 [Bacillus cereus]PGZ16422.1 hypothetical protein COE46_12105 [Bacillus cereus]
MVGVNYNFSSCFIHGEKNKFFRYQSLRCKHFHLYIEWSCYFFAPIKISDRGFFLFLKKQILNNSESYDKIFISAYKEGGIHAKGTIAVFRYKRRMYK